MRIKSYFANTMREAMEKARLELGPEALLLSSQRNTTAAPSDQFEVTFGVANPAGSGAGNAFNETIIGEQLAELRRQVEQMRRSLALGSSFSVVSAGTNKNPWIECLLEMGFSLPLAQEIAQSAQTRVPADAPRKGKARGQSGRKRRGETAIADSGPAPLLDEIDSRFSVAPDFDSSESERQIVVLVGPPGAGKTTTLVKLAIVYGTARRIPLQILSTDTLRLGGAEQLQSYSKILGASFQAVGGRQKLAEALEGSREKKLILIDTPGFSPADVEEAAELSSFLARCASVNVQLVLPATLHAPAMMSALDRFWMFRPSKLVFTHLDEVDSPGSLLEGAIRSGLPISFLANGQQIPENLVPASKAELRHSLLTKLTGSAAAAA